MNRHHAALFSDLERHSEIWTSTSRENAVAVISEYRYLAERLAGQFGAFHQNFTGDGHLFLFHDADAAVVFGCSLIEEWRACYDVVHVLRGAPRIALRLGCHFGECFAIEDHWIGRGIALAKRVEATAAPDTLYVTENVLELIDLTSLDIQPTGEHALKGDFLARRALYRLRRKARADEVGPTRETPDALFLRSVKSADTEEEERLLCRALALRPDFPEAHNNLAVVLRLQGKLDSAAEHYRQALQLRHDYPEAHSNYAYLLELLGRLDGALEHAEEAVRLRPGYVEGHHRLANLLAARGELERAVAHYETTLDLRPTYAEAHNNLAIVYERLDRREPAEVHYKLAVRLKPDHAPALYNWAILLESTGRPDRAVEIYRRALRVWPDFAEAHNNLAVLLHAAGDWEGAETHYRAAVGLRPNDPEARHNLALLLQATGREDEASRHFRAARELLPEQAQFVSSMETPD